MAELNQFDTVAATTNMKYTDIAILLSEPSLQQVIARKLIGI